jgi:hypothetical protein
MTDNNEAFGPLAALIGTWEGSKGMDVSPEPDGMEASPYYETLSFDAVGDVTNAEEQTMMVVHYCQTVTRTADNKVFHDETGYLMWDADRQVIMQSLVIPRGVALLAGGSHDGSVGADRAVTIDVAAREDDPHFNIAQSPFMTEKARTTGFDHRISVNGDTLVYTETTYLDIYGRSVEHTDENTLSRVQD